MLRKTLLASIIAASVIAAGCGGGDSSPPPSEPAPAKFAVNGPLDPVQEGASDTVISQLAGAVAGTPLEGVLSCADAVVVHDALDVGDALALALMDAATTQNPDALLGAADNVQGSLLQLANDLQGLLDALAGSGDCSGAAPPPGGNPLAGTPLEPLGEALAPVIAQIQDALAGTGGGGSDEDQQLASVAALVAALNGAMQDGLSQVPDEARSAPVVGGVLATVSHALNQLATLTSVAATYDNAATQAQLQLFLNDTLVNVLTQVVPVAFLEEQAGQPGLISNQVRDAAGQVSAELAAGLGTVTQPVLEQALAGALEPALDPIENQVLPAIIGPILDAIGGGLPTTPGLPTGTPLDPVIAAVQDALDEALGNNVLPCVFTGTPLAALCSLLG